MNDLETRQKYDLGDDPNDPYRGQGGGGNPFEGFNPFGGAGGFRFQQGGGGGGFPGGGFQFHFDL